MKEPILIDRGERIILPHERIMRLITEGHIYKSGLSIELKEDREVYYLKDTGTTLIERNQLIAGKIPTH